MNIYKLNYSVSPFAGISFANNSFNKIGISQLIDNELGRRVKTIGYNYSEILRNLSNVFLSGGGVIDGNANVKFEQITTIDFMKNK